MPKKSSNKNTGSPSFETNLQRLEEIVEHLESGEKSLDEVVTMFEEGVITGVAGVLEKMWEAGNLSGREEPT